VYFLQTSIGIVVTGRFGESATMGRINQ